MHAELWNPTGPYLWAVFFKADGSTLAVTDAGTVSGNCVVMPSEGSHGNLGEQPSTITVQEPPGTPPGYYSEDPTVTYTWSVPSSVGLWTTRITPIPVAPSLHGLLGPDQPGVFGVVAVLMNQGPHLPDHAAEAGHRAFNTGVGNAVNHLLRTLGADHPAITQDDINGVVATVAQQVQDAIVGDLSLLEKLWALTEADLEIGQQVWRWDQDAVATPSGQMTLANDPNTPYRDLYADAWTITGSLLWSDPCPADALAYVFNALLGDRWTETDTAAPTPEWHAAMRRFRDNGDFAAPPGLAHWWNLAAGRSAHLTHLAVSDEEFRTGLSLLLVAAGSRKPGRQIPSGTASGSRPRSTGS